MASRKRITPSPAAQGRMVPLHPASQQECSYCPRPISKPILAAGKPYCGKLCAALGLIAEVDREDNIEWEVGSFESLLGSIKAGDELPLYPVRMRWSEADRGPDDEWAVVVAIDDDRTPDYSPDPDYFPPSTLCSSQCEIDITVEKLLSQSWMGGEGAAQ